MSRYEFSEKGEIFDKARALALEYKISANNIISQQIDIANYKALTKAIGKFADITISVQRTNLFFSSIPQGHGEHSKATASLSLVAEYTFNRKKEVDGSPTEINEICRAYIRVIDFDILENSMVKILMDFNENREEVKKTANIQEKYEKLKKESFNLRNICSKIKTKVYNEINGLGKKNNDKTRVRNIKIKSQNLEKKLKEECLYTYYIVFSKNKSHVFGEEMRIISNFCENIEIFMPKNRYKEEKVFAKKVREQIEKSKKIPVINKINQEIEKVKSKESNENNFSELIYNIIIKMVKQEINSAGYFNSDDFHEYIPALIKMHKEASKELDLIFDTSLLSNERFMDIITVKNIMED